LTNNFSTLIFTQSKHIPVNNQETKGTIMLRNSYFGQFCFDIELYKCF